jgi:hypothetical protein
MNPQEIAPPVKVGIQGYRSLKILDSGFRRNDGKTQMQTVMRSSGSILFQVLRKGK